MRRRAIWATCLFATASAIASAETIPPQPVDGTIDWVYDRAEGKRLAGSADKPVFLVFRCER